MRSRRIGPFTVSAIGLGAMPFSMGKDPLPPEDQAIRTVHAALDAGVTLIDTADVYAPSWDTYGHNEKIVAKALASYEGDTDDIVVATKTGIVRHSDDSRSRDASLEHLRGAVDKARTNLDRDVIDIFQYHRPDRELTYRQAMENYRTLLEDGTVRAIGISNANIEEIEIAIEVLGQGGLASVQNEFSPLFRYSEAELEYCGEHGVTFLPWSPLGGIARSKDVGSRFSVINDIAEAHDATPYQVVLAWELGLGDHVLPIPGASRPESITDSAKAAGLTLTAEEQQQISGINLGIR